MAKVDLYVRNQKVPTDGAVCMSVRILGQVYSEGNIGVSVGHWLASCTID